MPFVSGTSIQTVGETLGALDVGATVGRSVGFAVGEPEGLGVGFTVGEPVGLF